MRRTQIKFLAAGLVLIAATTYLAVAGVQKGWVYYMQVDQFVAAVQHHDKRVRLCGRVGRDNLQVNPGLLQARFELMGETRQVSVVYRGVVPDTFKANVEVVIEGRLDDAGLFQADLMMTKCASKYQSEEHVKRLENQS